MGFGGISIWSLLLILVIVLLLFGTKKLRNIGTDLGGAIKGFKSAMSEGEKEGEQSESEHTEQGERLSGSQSDDDRAQARTTQSGDEQHRDRHTS